MDNVEIAKKAREGGRRWSHSTKRQAGMALVVTLMLLAVMALASLVTLRGALQQQRMAANQYDRHTAFERAETALRVAQRGMSEGAIDTARRCEANGPVCLSNPFADPRLPAGSIRSVAPHGSEDGAASSTASGADRSQYIIEGMGSWNDPDAATPDDPSNKNAVVPVAFAYYRITARSADPSFVGDRVVVVLQAIVRRRVAVAPVEQPGAIERVSWRELPNA